MKELQYYLDQFTSWQLFIDTYAEEYGLNPHKNIILLSIRDLQSGIYFGVTQNINKKIHYLSYANTVNYIYNYSDHIRNSYLILTNESQQQFNYLKQNYPEFFI